MVFIAMRYLIRRFRNLRSLKYLVGFMLQSAAILALALVLSLSCLAIDESVIVSQIPDIIISTDQYALFEGIYTSVINLCAIVSFCGGSILGALCVKAVFDG